MSLIGSLEDLGLGDILQIISLSQKSGILSIRGDEGEGTIFLQAGLVRGATLKGGPTDLRGLLVDGKFVSGEEFDAARADARQRGISLEEGIASHTSVTVERIDSLRRECVEAAVMAMFGWPGGEFSFDVQTDPVESDVQLLLPTGINAQYLAMEGTRIGDESAHVRADSSANRREEPVAELSAHEMFGVTPPEEAVVAGAGVAPVAEVQPDVLDVEREGGPIEALGLAVVERIDDVDEPEPAVPTELVDEPRDGAPMVDRSQPQPMEPAEHAQECVEAQAAPLGPRAPGTPLVVIDPDLMALEWIKQSVKDAFGRVHIFQRWDLGLNPIRQYMARTVSPFVLLHVDAPGDPLSGIRNPADFVTRLRLQQPRIQVVLLRDHDAVDPIQTGDADGIVSRPSSRLLRSARGAEAVAAIRAELCAQLAPQPAGTGDATRPGAVAASGASGESASEQELAKLRAVTARLSDASNRGEVLPVVLRFASEIFDRVALFMVRGDTVLGIAQHGLARAGGPGDDDFREVEMRPDSCAWFHEIFATRSSTRSGPTDAGDFTLAARLGGTAAEEAYLAPIESGGEVVAILYADNLPARRRLGDVHALEVVLHHAGLALERAMLARALAEA